MKVLFYNNCLDGHNLEYIHHWYEKAVNEKDKSFIFILPEKFESLKAMMKWSETDNITFDFLSGDETRKCNKNKLFHFLGTQTYSAWLLAKKINKYNPDYVFMDIDQGIPFLDLFFPHRAKARISCISYRIIPYEWGTLPWIKKTIEWVTYHVVLKKDRYQTVFLLNNHKYIEHYNNKFKTSKYKYLTDPVTTDLSIGFNIRNSLDIPDDAKVFVHLGVMGRHKGTINILNALAMLSDEETAGMYFIFAGVVGFDIKDEFYEKFNQLKKKRNLIVYDEFCEYELFCSLYKTCDYVLFPYIPRPNSSGLLGNAALYGKPVITTDGGAMGDLVREYHLGCLMPDNSPQSICSAIRSPAINEFNPDEYVKDHTIQNFCDTIFSEFI